MGTLLGFVRRGPAPEAAGGRKDERVTARSGDLLSFLGGPERLRVLLVGGDQSARNRITDLAEGTGWPTIELAGAVALLDQVDQKNATRDVDVVVRWCSGRLSVADASFVSAVAKRGTHAVVVVGGEGDHGRQARESHRCGAAAYVPGPAPDPAALLVAITNAAQRARLVRRVVDLQSRLAMLLRNAEHARWEYDPTTEQLRVSPHWMELFGDIGDFEHATNLDAWARLVHPEDEQTFLRSIHRFLQEDGALGDLEIRMRTADGTYRWFMVRGVHEMADDGPASRVVGTLTDVTELRERMDHVRAQARLDALTGLPRREVFYERLARAIEVLRDWPDAGYVVLLIEVEGLRRFNESIGHHAGDRVLAALARRFEECVDADTMIARFAGAKFAVLVENVTDFDLGARLADRFDAVARKPVDVDGEHVYVGVSVGITTSERNYRHVDDVISDVSTAASRAKQLSRGTKKRSFSTNMRMEALTKMRLEMALREAVEREEFDLHFQPIVSLVTGRLTGFEALIRWESPTRGRISPAEFIPIAEATGLILPIGRWAIRQAAKTLRWFVDHHPAAKALGVSVNLSARQVADPDLLHGVARVLNETEIDPENLKIELTESVLMDNMDEVVALLTSLRELGVKIWVDDFGTGYSSLSYLHRFPVDGLKVDKTFVDGLGPDPTDSSVAMVRTMVSLSEQLGVDLVAEGIETQEQADFLRRLGCSAGQGYFFGRPCPADQALALLRQERGASVG